jgi:hypothetical protein
MVLIEANETCHPRLSSDFERGPCLLVAAAGGLDDVLGRLVREHESGQNRERPRDVREDGSVNNSQVPDAVGDEGAGGLETAAHDVDGVDKLGQVVIAVDLPEAEVDVGGVGSRCWTSRHLNHDMVVVNGAHELPGAVVIEHAGPEALEGKAAAPGVDVAVLGLGGRLEEQGGLAEAGLNVVVGDAQEAGLVVLGHFLALAGDILYDLDAELPELLLPLVRRSFLK